MKDFLFKIFIAVVLVTVVVVQTGCASKNIDVPRVSLIQEAADNGCEITSAERRSNLERVRCK